MGTPEPSNHPVLLIGGTPRSGTTLAQRLVAERFDVATTPETHYFSVVLPHLLRDGSFPFDASRVEALARLMAMLPATEELEIDIDRLSSSVLGGVGPVGLFNALIRTVEPRCEGAIPCEKTPSHLPWFRRLASVDPDFRFLVLTRHPVDVVASNLAVPFGMSDPVLLALRWRADQRELERLVRRHADRVTVVRYEDAVDDVAALDRAAEGLIGSRSRLRRERTIDAQVLRTSRERGWKSASVAGAVQKPEARPIDPATRGLIQRICVREMARLEYEPHPGRTRWPTAREVARAVRFGAGRLAAGRMQRRALRSSHLAPHGD